MVQDAVMDGPSAGAADAEEAGVEETGVEETGVANRLPGMPCHVEPTRPGAGAPVSRRRRHLAAVALVAALLLACGATPYFLTMAPAGTLVIDVSVVGQWGDATNGPDGTTSPDVMLEVRISDRTHGFIAFRGGQSFVCAGVLGPTPSPAAPRLDVGVLTVPRQPPGGAYRCVYTDERGRQTPLAVPVPAGTLAITSPRPGAKVPAPYANPPEPVVTGTAAVTPSVRPQPTATLIPSAVPLFIRYTLPVLPPGARGAASGEGDCGGCFAVFGTEQPLSGTYELFGPGTSSTGGYTIQEPQHGQIILNTKIAWALADSGFAAVHVMYLDHFEVPVTWVPA